MDDDTNRSIVIIQHMGSGSVNDGCFITIRLHWLPPKRGDTTQPAFLVDIYLFSLFYGRFIPPGYCHPKGINDCLLG